MSLPRYERYKESGVAWLGEVPEHWDTMRLRILVEIKKRIVGELGHDVLSITQQGIRIKDTESNEGQLALDYSKYQLVKPGDFAMNHMDLLTGFVDIASMHGVTSPDYRVFSVRPGIVCSKRYLLYVFQNAYRQRIFYAFGQGSSHLGRWRLPTEEFNNFVVPFPSMDEQEQVTVFLDRETAKIDSLIEEQRRLIVLLKEKRQAVISHAVTKGLNPSAPMQDSGQSYIGLIPKHWSAKRLKLLILRGTSISYGIVQPGEPLSENEGTPFIQTTNLSTASFSLDSLQRTTNEIAAAYPRSRLSGGEVILGIRASIGAAFVVPDHLNGANLSRGIARIVPSESICACFLVWALRADCTSEYWRMSRQGTTFVEVSIDTVRELWVATPPLDEQREIAAHLDSECARFEDAIRAADETSSLLQERRSALISAAVTGKINVTAQVAKPVRSTWSAGFARQVLAAETLSRCNGPRMGRIKLQKLIHLCEYHAQLDEVCGTYSRQAAGPFAPQVMEDVREGLLRQRWFEEYKDESRYAYRALEKTGGHKQYLSHWEDKQARIDHVLNLLGGELTRRCEIVSTLYAAWNDLLIEGRKPTDAEIIREASSAERWHESKEKIAAEKWPESLKWMRANGLVPVGYGTHTTHQPDLFMSEGHELA